MEATAIKTTNATIEELGAMLQIACHRYGGNKSNKRRLRLFSAVATSRDNYGYWVVLYSCLMQTTRRDHPLERNWVFHPTQEKQNFTGGGTNNIM